MAREGNKIIDFKDALAFVLDGNESDVSGFSSDEDDDEPDDNPMLLNRDEANEETVGQSYELRGNDKKDNTDETILEGEELPAAMKKQAYRWRKKEIPKHNEVFNPEVSEDEKYTAKTPLDYFKMCWLDTLLS